MTVLPRHQLTADEFVGWSEITPGRFELLHGYVYEMASERTQHAEVKFEIQVALRAAIRTAGVHCHMLPDGIRVRVSPDSAFEPDALVYCGDKHPGTTLEVNNPVIVVEVLSPSSRSIDASAKLAGYFLLPSVVHYLIVDPNQLPVIHHARQPDGTILTRLVSSGTITMAPPGIAISVDGLLD